MPREKGRPWCEDGAVPAPSSDIGRPHPAAAGLIALGGYAVTGAVLALVAHTLGAPSLVVAVACLVGCVLGYLASRSLLRRLYVPR